MAGNCVVKRQRAFGQYFILFIYFFKFPLLLLFVLFPLLLLLLIILNVNIVKIHLSYLSFKNNCQSHFNGLIDRKGPENTSYTIGKYGETFYGLHTALTPAVVKVNKF